MGQLNQVLESETVTLVRILEHIRREGPISQVEIGQRLGIGRAAVNVHTKKLLAEGIVHQVGNQEGAMGRPRVLLDLNRSGKAVLGISLDAPNLSGAVMDFANRPVVECSRDVSDVGSQEALAERVVSLVKQLLAEAQQRELELHACCFSVPGVLEMGTGRVLKYVNMPAANGFDAKQVLGQLLGVPIYVVPLASALYWGGLEADEEGQRIFHVFWDLGVGMTFGHGYEVGFNEYERSPTEVNDSLREIGHVIVHPGGRHCYCGRRGCLEAYFGGHALIDRWNARTKSDDQLTFSGFLSRAREQDPAVVRLVTRQARRLGETLGWIFTVHKPARVKLSGQIPDAGQWVFDAFASGLHRRIGGEALHELDPRYVPGMRSLRLLGSCRLAIHVRFNRPLLPIVSDDRWQGATSSMVVVG